MIVFLPPTAVRACDNLANRYDSNRSEVIRIAVSEGMAGVRVALARLQKVRSAEREAVEERRSIRRRGPTRASSVAASAAVGSLDGDDAVAALVEYGNSARRIDPHLGAAGLAVMLATHARVSGVDPEDLDVIVDRAVQVVLGESDVALAPDPTAPPE